MQMKGCAAERVRGQLATLIFLHTKVSRRQSEGQQSHRAAQCTCHYCCVYLAIAVTLNAHAHAGEGVEKAARKVSQAYAQGLTWVLSYYCHGTAPVAVSLAVRHSNVYAGTLLPSRGTVHVPARCLFDSCCFPQCMALMQRQQHLSFGSSTKLPAFKPASTKWWCCYRPLPLLQAAAAHIRAAKVLLWPYCIAQLPSHVIVLQFSFCPHRSCENGS